MQVRLETLLDLLIAVLGQRQGRYASTEFIVCFELLMMDEPYCGQCFVRAFEGKQPGFFTSSFFHFDFIWMRNMMKWLNLLKEEETTKRIKKIYRDTYCSYPSTRVSFWPGCISTRSRECVHIAEVTGVLWVKDPELFPLWIEITRANGLAAIWADAKDGKKILL